MVKITQMSVVVAKRRRLRWLRWLLRAVVALVLAVALYFLGFWAVGCIAVNTDSVQPSEGIEIWVIHRGVHVDFAVPVHSDVHDWGNDIDVAAFDRPPLDPTHLVVGWGDRGFYLETPTWSDLRVSTALRAVSYTGRTALHLELMLRPATNASQRRLVLTPAQYRDLVAYIRDAFARDVAGRPQVIAGVHYGDATRPGQDAFYEAVGRYGLFYTCNTWVNQGLRRIGVRTALWAVFGSSIMQHMPPPD